MNENKRQPLSPQSSRAPLGEQSEAPLEAPVSMERRVRETLLSIPITLAACATVWLSQWRSDQLAEYWWYAWPIALMGLVTALYFALRKSAPTKEAIEIRKRAEMEVARKQIEQQRKDDEFFDTWYVRYAMASAFVIFGIWVYSERPSLWWAALLGVGVAALLARELTLLCIALAVVAGLVYLIWQAFVVMPTAAAILIGAVIIAAAIRSRR
jgi:hypothetical protein